LEVYLDGDD